MVRERETAYTGQPRQTLDQQQQATPGIPRQKLGPKRSRCKEGKRINKTVAEMASDTRKNDRNDIGTQTRGQNDIGYTKRVTMVTFRRSSDH